MYVRTSLRNLTSKVLTDSIQAIPLETVKRKFLKDYWLSAKSVNIFSHQKLCYTVNPCAHLHSLAIQKTCSVELVVHLLRNETV